MSFIVLRIDWGFYELNLGSEKEVLNIKEKKVCIGTSGMASVNAYSFVE